MYESGGGPLPASSCLARCDSRCGPGQWGQSLPDPRWNRQQDRNEERLALGSRRIHQGHFLDTHPKGQVCLSSRALTFTSTPRETSGPKPGWHPTASHHQVPQVSPLRKRVAPQGAALMARRVNERRKPGTAPTSCSAHNSRGRASKRR